MKKRQSIMYANANSPVGQVVVKTADEIISGLRAELAAAREEIKALSVAASALTKEAIEQDAKIAKLRALCAAEETALRGIALMTDNATATHLLMVCDRLAAGRGEGTK